MPTTTLEVLALAPPKQVPARTPIALPLAPLSPSLEALVQDIEASHAPTPGRATSRRAMVVRGVLGVAMLVALTAIGLAYFQRVLALVGEWGYLSVLVIETINSATILIPTPGRAITLAHAVMLNPWIVGVLAGIGSSLGEITGYIAGRSGRQSVVGNRYMRWLEARWQRQADVVVFMGALLPLPFDVVGVWAGANRYPVVRWFALMTPAKVIKMIAMAFAARYGLGWFLG